MPADAVLGERRPAQPNHLAAECQDRFLPRLHVGERSRDDVRVQVSVGDVSPDRGVEAATFEFLVVQGHQGRERLERHDHVRRGLGDARVDVVLRAPHARIDGRRHFLPQCDELRRASVIAGHGNLDRIEHASLVHHPAEARQPRVGRRRFARAADLVEGVGRGGARQQLQRDQERNRGIRRNSNPEPAVGAVLSEQGESTPVHVLDGRHIEAVRVPRAPGLGGRIAQPRDDAERRSVDR